MEQGLFYFGLLIQNVFADNGIVFLHRHLVRHIALVLGGCVVVTGAR